MASQAFHRIAGEREHGAAADEIATRYPDRIVIFDSPPLLVTSEARELAAHMGQIVMVVEAGRTSQEAVAESLRYIEGCDIVNLLMNKSDSVAWRRLWRLWLRLWLWT